MDVRHYLLRSTTPAVSTSADLEATALGAARDLQVATTVEDFSLVMGEPSLAAEVTGSAEQHQQLLAAWASRGLQIENLDDEVHTLT